VAGVEDLCLFIAPILYPCAQAFLLAYVADARVGGDRQLVGRPPRSFRVPVTYPYYEHSGPGSRPVVEGELSMSYNVTEVTVFKRHSAARNLRTI